MRHTYLTVFKRIILKLNVTRAQAGHWIHVIDHSITLASSSVTDCTRSRCRYIEKNGKFAPGWIARQIN